MENKKRDILFNLLFDNSFEVLITFDRDGKVIKWNSNAEKQLGYNQPEEIFIYDIFPREFRKTENGVDLIKKGQISTFAYRKNQTCFPVELRIIIEEQEKEFFGVCSFINVADRLSALKTAEKAQEEVNQANQTRNEFVSNVTHELRTPVNGIKGITHALSETPLTEEQKGLLKIIDRCCENMSHIINDLLDFSKLHSGKFTLEEREFKFREFLDRAVETNLHLINEKRLTLRVNVNSEVPEHLIGDELRLTQILNNLLSNSIKFTTAGQISVEVNKSSQDENGEVELFFMVMDTGIGIDKEDIDKLFKSFSQVDASITRKYGGTGLGLSITKELVELMKGKVFVESEVGRGSTFSFSVRLKAVDLGDIGEPVKEPENFIYEGLNKKEVAPLSFSEEEKELFTVNEALVFGSEENKNEIYKHMEKLALCIEMENWEKAEELAGALKKFVGSEKAELKRGIFLLELSVRKEAKEKSIELYENFDKMLESIFQ